MRPSGFPGAIVAGFLHLFQTPRRWTVAEDPQAAFDWLLHKDAGAALAETEALVESLASAAFELARLRAILAQKPSTPLAESSRAMSLSTRTLQRTLREHGVTYRQLQSEQRLELVRQLLASSDEKISEVARRVGLANANQLSRFFQRQTGELPGAYRKRVRGGDMR